MSAEKAEARFSPYRVYNKEIIIVGSMAVLHSFERAGDLFVGGTLRPEVMISDRFPMADYPQAIEQFANGIGRKIQVNPAQLPGAVTLSGAAPVTPGRWLACTGE